MRRKTHKEFLIEVEKAHGKEYTVLTEYEKSEKKVKVRHDKCGYVYDVKPFHLSRGHGCPKCRLKDRGLKRRTTHEKFLQQLREVHGEKYEPLEKYKTSKTKIKMQHKDCGHVYSVAPMNILGGGNECPKCAEIKRRITSRKYTHDDFVKMVKEKGLGEYEVLGNYEKVAQKVRLRHNSCGHEWEVSPLHFKNGRRCPVCSRNRIYESKRKSQQQYEGEVQNLYNGEYSVMGDYKNSVTKIRIKHEKCGYEWDIVAGSFLLGHGCPKCNSSKGEKAIRQLLKEKGLDFKEQYSFSDCRNKLPLPFDFAVMDKCEVLFLIEYHGGQHYEPVEFYGGQKKFERLKKHDKIKQDYCKTKGIPLLIIPHWEKDNIPSVIEKYVNKKAS